MIPERQYTTVLPNSQYPRIESHWPGLGDVLLGLLTQALVICSHLKERVGINLIQTTPKEKSRREKELWTIKVLLPSQQAGPQVLTPLPCQDHDPGVRWEVAL